MDMYFTACYDADTFRGLVLSPGFLRRFQLEDGLVEQLAQDDEVLLRFAFRFPHTHVADFGHCHECFGFARE
jgi:hypothetical protein